MFSGYFQGFLVLTGVAFVGIFLQLFLIPAIKSNVEYKKVIKDLKKLSETKGTSDVIESVKSQVMTSKLLTHLWSEYSETLHKQQGIVDGEYKISAIRATAPSDVFFNSDVLVDTPLKTEFFKHLPGIFTGIGIIATFNGLISGLTNFSTSFGPGARQSAEIQAAAQQAAITELLTHVSHAFVFSAAAIGIAMLVTFVEKIIVANGYKQAEEIAQLIDSFFDAGVGEEYLANIVKSSAESAISSSELRTGLIEDLKPLLTNLAERQMQAAQENSNAIAKTIGDAIEVGLSGPMNDLKKGIEKVTANQGDAVSDLLSVVVDKLQSTFGSQMENINNLMTETTASMQSMQSNFSELIKSMAGAGKDAGEAMANQLKDAIESSELRQKEMNEQMEKFVVQISKLVSSSQDETNTQVKSMLTTIEANTKTLIEDLNKEQQKINTNNKEQQDNFSSKATEVVEGMSEQLSTLIAQTVEITNSLKENMQSLTKVTLTSIEKMNAGAETLYSASSEFSKAGNAVSNVLNQTSSLSERLLTASAGLDASAKLVANVVTEFQRTKDQMTSLTVSLESLIIRAKSEAGMTQKILQEMTAITQSFNQAEQDVQAYLENVSNVIDTSFRSFSLGLTNAIKQSNTEFHKSMSDAVGMLRAVIEELAENQGKN